MKNCPFSHQPLFYSVVGVSKQQYKIRGCCVFLFLTNNPQTFAFFNFFIYKPLYPGNSNSKLSMVVDTLKLITVRFHAFDTSGVKRLLFLGYRKPVYKLFCYKSFSKVVLSQCDTVICIFHKKNVIMIMLQDIIKSF